MLPSKLAVPHPLPPPHVSLTPPYVQLTGWIRDLLVANQLTFDQIKALRKPFRVVSATGGGQQRVHRVECIIYPVTNYAEQDETAERTRRPKVVVSGRLVRQGDMASIFIIK